MISLLEPMNEIIYGIHSVRALIENEPKNLQKVFVLKGQKNKRLLSLIHVLKERNIRIHLKNRQFLNKESKGAVHQGIIAYTKAQKKYLEKDFISQISKFDNPFFLILENISDPHNLGACLRSAKAAGVHAVIIPKNHSAKINATVKKVSCGASETIPVIYVTNLIRIIKILKKENIWIIGSSRKANDTLYQNKIIDRIALIMGSENKGIRHLTREYCDKLIKIPIIGNIASLNVSVATGVCLFEIVRRRNLFSFIKI